MSNTIYYIYLNQSLVSECREDAASKRITKLTKLTFRRLDRFRRSAYLPSCLGLLGETVIDGDAFGFFLSFRPSTHRLASPLVSALIM